MSTTEPSAFALVDLLQQQAERHGDWVAFHLRPEGDDEHDRHRKFSLKRSRRPGSPPRRFCRGTAAKQQMAPGLARFVGRSARQRRESD